jgi:hypothetical protein
MYVYKVRKRKYIAGSGFIDWVAKVASFISANKDTITGVSDVVGNVAKAGATTVSAIKQIRDTVKAKKDVAISNKKELSQESRDILQQYMGGGFKMISY